MMNLFIKSWNWQLAKKYIVRLTEEERNGVSNMFMFFEPLEGNGMLW